jgi:hypothetical protein
MADSHEMTSLPLPVQAEVEPSGSRPDISTRRLRWIQQQSESLHVVVAACIVSRQLPQADADDAELQALLIGIIVLCELVRLFLHKRQPDSGPQPRDIRSWLRGSSLLAMASLIMQYIAVLAPEMKDDAFGFWTLHVGAWFACHLALQHPGDLDVGQNLHGSGPDQTPQRAAMARSKLWQWARPIGLTLNRVVVTLAFALEIIFMGLCYETRGAGLAWYVALAYAILVTRILDLYTKSPGWMREDICEWIESEEFGTWYYRCLLAVVGFICSGAIGLSDILLGLVGSKEDTVP